MRSHIEIFLKSSNYPRQRYGAVRARYIKKISLRVLFEIFERFSIKIFLRSYEDSTYHKISKMKSHSWDDLKKDMGPGVSKNFFLTNIF